MCVSFVCRLRSCRFEIEQSEPWRALARGEQLDSRRLNEDRKKANGVRQHAVSGGEARNHERQQEYEEAGEGRGRLLVGKHHTRFVPAGRSSSLQYDRDVHQRPPWIGMWARPRAYRSDHDGTLGYTPRFLYATLAISPLPGIHYTLSPLAPSQPIAPAPAQFPHLFEEIRTTPAQKPIPTGKPRPRTHFSQISHGQPALSSERIHRPVTNIPPRIVSIAHADHHTTIDQKTSVERPH